MVCFKKKIIDQRITGIGKCKGYPKTNDCIYNKGQFKNSKYISQLGEYVWKPLYQ